MSKGNYILYTYIIAIYCMALHGSPIKLPIICNHHTSTISTHLNPNITKHMSKDLSMNPEIVRDKGIRYLYIL